MKKNEKKGDNWSLLLTDLGLEQSKENEPENEPAEAGSEVIAVKEVVEEKSVPAPRAVRNETKPESRVEPKVASMPEDSFGAGLLDEVPVPIAKIVEAAPETKGEPAEESTEEPAGKPKSGKKRFFDRFPKVNLFGSPAKESLDPAPEGSRPTGLGGKSFTSNRLEKVPHAPERGSRKEEAPKPVAEPNGVSDRVKADNPWSTITSQVDALSEAKDEASKPKAETPRRDDSKGKPPKSDVKPGRERGKRHIPSMFDDPTPEPEESVKLKSIMGSDDARDFEAERRLSSMFDRPASEKNRPAPEPPRQRDERPREERQDDRPRRGRGARYEETKVKEPSDRKPVGDESPDRPTKPEKSWEGGARDGRGRRGSRYPEQESARRESRREDDVFVETGPVREEPAWAESAWSGDEEPRQNRGSRNRERRPEKAITETSSRETAAPEPDYTGAPVQKSIPSWDDAIGAIIDGNITRHGQRPRKSGNRR